MRLDGINKPIDKTIDVDSTIEDEELYEARRIERMTPEEYDAYLVAKYGIDGAWLIKHEVDGGRTEASSLLQPQSDMEAEVGDLFMLDPEETEYESRTEASSLLQPQSKTTDTFKSEMDSVTAELDYLTPEADEYEALYGSNEPNPFVESTKPVSQEELYSNLDEPKEDYDFGFDWDEKPKKNGPKM